MNNFVDVVIKKFFIKAENAMPNPCLPPGRKLGMTCKRLRLVFTLLIFHKILRVHHVIPAKAGIRFADH